MVGDEDKHNKPNEDITMTDTDNMPGSSREISVAAQKTNLPSYWESDPKLWFLTADVQFNVQQITADKTKFAQTLSSLTKEACTSIQDVLENLPNENRYETIKKALIERNSMSEERKLETLLSKSEMGDMRPSEVLRQIKLLAGNSYSPALIKSLWLRKLTEFIRLALVPQQDDKTSDELAKTGDKLFEAMNSQQIVGAITHQARHQRREFQRPDRERAEYQPLNSKGSTMEERVERLELMLAKLTNRSRSRSQSRRFPSRPRYQSNSPSRQSRKPLVYAAITTNLATQPIDAHNHVNLRRLM